MQILKFADDNKAAESTEVLLVFGILSASFLAVYLIHSFWFRKLRKGQRNWPLYISILLVVFGALVYAAEYYNWSFGIVLLGDVWPIILVLIGLKLLFRAFKENKSA